MDPVLVILAALGIAGGGFLKGATGAGAPVLGIPVLAIIFDVPTAVAIFSVLNVFTNVWQSWSFRSDLTDPTLAWRFAGFGAGGAIMGSVLLALLPTDVLMASVALVVFLYIALKLMRPDWHIQRAAGHRLAPLTGAVGGILQGAGGLSAPVSITFLNALGLGRGEFIAVISVFFLVMSVVQVPTLWALGILTPDWAALGVAAILPISAGMWAGAWSAKRLSKRAFDRAILVLLAVIALKLLGDAIWG